MKKHVNSVCYWLCKTIRLFNQVLTLTTVVSTIYYASVSKKKLEEPL